MLYQHLLINNIDSCYQDLLVTADTANSLRKQLVGTHFFSTYAVEEQNLPLKERQKVEAEGVWINVGLWGVLFLYLVFLRILRLSPSRFINYIRRIPAIRDSSFDKPSFPVQVLLFMPGFAMASFLLYKLLQNTFLFTYNVMPSLSWFQSACVLFGITLIVSTMEWLLSLIFDVLSVFKAYITDQLLIFNIATISLAPFMLFYFYNQSNIFLYIGLSIAILFGILHWVRMLIIIRKKTFFSLFYIFVYLCGVKILPVLLIIKWGVVSLV